VCIKRKNNNKDCAEWRHFTTYRLESNVQYTYPGEVNSESSAMGVLHFPAQVDCTADDGCVKVYKELAGDFKLTFNETTLTLQNAFDSGSAIECWYEPGLTANVALTNQNGNRDEKADEYRHGGTLMMAFGITIISVQGLCAFCFIYRGRGRGAEGAEGAKVAAEAAATAGEEADSELAARGSPDPFTIGQQQECGRPLRLPALLPPRQPAPAPESASSHVVVDA
jgi:hypothetical protein